MGTNRPKYCLRTGLISLTIYFFFQPCIVLSQTVIFKGIIKDEQTLKPIRDVNIKVHGTNKGTSTDQAGTFTLRFNKFPASLVFTCVGYEAGYYEISGTPKDPVEFLLRPKSYLLREVDISSKKYSFLFKDKDFSVLDYELFGDNVLLLIFRYHLKRSELVLLDRGGDTLAISKLPEVPPASLFKDFLGNVHYFSKADNSYQCYYNEGNHSIEFLFKTTVDSLRSIVKPYLFSLSDRLYFQEIVLNGFGTAFGFYEKDTGKKYIRNCLNHKKISEYKDDQTFYRKWNNLFGASNLLVPDDIESDLAFDFSISRGEGGGYGVNEARAHQFEFYNMIYPVIKTGDDTIVFFNFSTGVIELMDKNGTIRNTVPVTFHKGSASGARPGTISLSNAGWRWGSSILADEFTRHVHTTFHMNGMVKVQQIDLETGNLSNGTVLPFPFPEKIEIYKGDAYFLVKNDGSYDKWKLVKCKLVQ
jgi:hypothetical protein